MTENYLEVTEQSFMRLMERQVEGAITMLNLLRFRALADYQETPELAPDKPISGREAYDRYIRHTLPYLQDTGGSITFLGAGGDYLVGPSGRGWDMAMLIRQNSVADFLSFASNEAYLAGIGHRTAALVDSRILPLTDIDIPL